jgi:hypothetical protein
MISPEKGDVNITKLFEFSKQVSITFLSREFKGFMRLIGDAELNRARVFSLRKSRDLREALKNQNSDERLAYLADAESMSKEQLVDYIVYTQTREFVQQAYKEIDLPLPREIRSDAKLEDQEKYQKEVDEYPAKFDKELRKIVDKKIKSERVRLTDLTKELLYKEYELSTINFLCETEMTKRFKEMCVYFGTYSDEELKTRMFSSYDEFDNLPTDLKNLFVTEYESMEISFDDLKK